MKIMLLYIVVIVFNIYPDESRAQYTMPYPIREYSCTLYPYSFEYVSNGTVKKIVYNEDVTFNFDGSSTKPSSEKCIEYDQDGRISRFQASGDGIKIENNYRYSADGSWIIEKHQSDNHQLVDRKVVSIERVKDTDDEIKYRYGDQNNEINSELILKKENSIITITTLDLYERTIRYDFDETGLLLSIKKFDRWYKNERLNSLTQEIVEYTNGAVSTITWYAADQELSKLYDFQWNETTGLLDTIQIEDYSNDAQYIRSYIFSKYDENSNWTRIEFEVKEAGVVVYTKVGNRSIEYW